MKLGLQINRALMDQKLASGGFVMCVGIKMHAAILINSS